MDKLSGTVDEHEVLSRTALQGLYSLGGIETLHVITDAVGVTIRAFVVGEDGPREMAMPEGHYLIVRVTTPPTLTPGLFGIRSPLSPQSRKKSRGQA